MFLRWHNSLKSMAKYKKYPVIFLAKQITESATEGKGWKFDPIVLSCTIQTLESSYIWIIYLKDRQELSLIIFSKRIVSTLNTSSKARRTCRERNSTSFR